MVAAQLAPATGASEMLLGSVETCYIEAKQKLPGVKEETLATYSAQSQQTTNEMVQDLHRLLPAADVGAAVTGLCGLAASETPDKPVGTVFVAVLPEGHACEYRTSSTAAATGCASKQPSASTGSWRPGCTAGRRWPGPGRRARGACRGCTAPTKA